RDLTYFTLDMFIILSILDEYKRLFSSTKLTVINYYSKLKTDIIKAYKYL
ncbi:hypothetical protein BKA63DRAFT_415382, partial [Paraphoma chrysanthemicola]